MYGEPAASCRGRQRAIPEGAAASRRRAAARRIVACVLGAWLTVPGSSTAAGPRESAPPPAIAERLARLDCSRVTAADVRDLLARAAAPRIVLLQGSVALVTMEPFARFLVAMGYPAERVRNPRDGTFSYSSFTDSAALAGALAYDYERTGTEPMLIGHSQGGMVAIRVLHEFAGAFHDTLPVIDPATGEALARTTIIDPRTREQRQVVGMHVAYAAALATGWLPRVFLGQWTMIPRLRKIPDTVTEFTGFDIPNDPIAGNLLGIAPYEALGGARVRNVLLPGEYSHIALPQAAGLPDDPALREWIDGWRPDDESPLPAGDTANLLHAADIWHSVKRHWCTQAQRLLVTPLS